MKIEGTRFVMSPGGSALGLPAGEYWAVPDAELRRLQAALEKAKADARALWAADVLDAWAEANEEATPPVPTFHRYMHSRVGSAPVAKWTALVRGHVEHFVTAREARIRAARAIYPDLPESVRRELGECPGG